MRLYELDSTIAQVIERGFTFDEETGEVLFDESDLDALEAERAEKLEACACYTKSVEAEAAAIKAEIDALKERLDAKNRKAERMRDYMARSMLASGETKFETARCALSFRKSEAVELTGDALPAEFVKVKTTETVDKTAIKKAIKAGKTVAGAVLVERKNLQVK